MRRLTPEEMEDIAIKHFNLLLDECNIAQYLFAVLMKMVCTACINYPDQNEAFDKCILALENYKEECAKPCGTYLIERKEES
jgi:hypothetical protein